MSRHAKSGSGDGALAVSRREGTPRSWFFLLASALLVLFGHPAWTQPRAPAVGCEVADYNLMLRLYLPLAPDGSGAPAEMQGTLEVLHQKVPKDQRLWSLEGKRPAQFWSQGDELKLLILLGSGESLIRLVIETQRREQYGEHTGTFRLERGQVKVTGRLACNVG
jgi:hypothetical protein